MAFIDYYKVMGIPKDTPQKDIRAAYRKRSKQFHPDLHPDDPKAKAKFQMLNEAYEVLNDPEKRAKYDQYGENWKQAEQFGGGGFGTGGGNPFEGFSFNMGGDADPREVNMLAQYIHEEHPQFHVAWYSGRLRISPLINQTDFDYIKVGPYLRHLGPLSKPTTNQRLFRKAKDGTFEDITSVFWKKH